MSGSPLASLSGMDSGLYAAYTGLLARTQALDSSANNLANAGTNGFRAERDYFRGVLRESLGADAEPSQVGSAVNGFGVLGGTTLDFGQGQLATTGNPLDLGINGGGFFAVQAAHGTRYTRDGAFVRSSAGVLTDRQGEPVLSVDGASITIPSGIIHVADDGTLSVATDSGSAIAGRVGVFNVEAASLTAEGANRFALAPGAKATPSDGSVVQGSLEGANQDAVHGTMQLMLNQRQAEMMQKAIYVFDNGFDKVAAEELGKV